MATVSWLAFRSWYDDCSHCWTRLRRSDHISDALACLHWLRVPEKIEFKVAVLTYKVVHGLAPGYFGPFTRVADLSSRNRLIVSTSRLSTVGSRAFLATGQQIYLPEDVTSEESLTTFRRLLKTRLFSKSFPDYLLDINSDCIQWTSAAEPARAPSKCSKHATAWFMQSYCYLGHIKLIDWLTEEVKGGGRFVRTRSIFV